MLLKAVFLTSALTLAPLPALAARAPAGTAPGAIIGFKMFRGPLQPFNFTGTPSTYVPTNAPTNPVFTKRYDDTFIRCTTMVDAVPWTTYPLYIAIAVNGRPRAIQGLSTAVAHNEITFAFSYDIGPNAGG